MISETGEEEAHDQEEAGQVRFDLRGKGALRRSWKVDPESLSHKCRTQHGGVKVSARVTLLSPQVQGMDREVGSLGTEAWSRGVWRDGVRSYSL